jgi:hypothetical protein
VAILASLFSNEPNGNKYFLKMVNDVAQLHVKKYVILNVEKCDFKKSGHVCNFQNTASD